MLPWILQDYFQDKKRVRVGGGGEGGDMIGYSWYFYKFKNN